MTSNSNFPFRSLRLGLALIFTLFMAVASWAEITGSGTESDPYVISSVDDWNTAATESKYFSPSGGSFQYIKLADDLDFTGKTFNIFCGTVGYCSIHFDGQGYATPGYGGEPNVWCPLCGTGFFTTGIGNDGLTCNACGCNWLPCCYKCRAEDAVSVRDVSTGMFVCNKCGQSWLP